MTQRTARNLFLLALALVTLLALVLQGCATEYTWKRTHQSCGEVYTWIVVPRDQLYATCGQTKAYSNLGACVYLYPNCVAYSHLTEEQAKRTMSADGLTLHEHETEHLEGKTHQ